MRIERGRLGSTTLDCTRLRSIGVDYSRLGSTAVDATDGRSTAVEVGDPTTTTRDVVMKIFENSDVYIVRVTLPHDLPGQTPKTDTKTIRNIPRGHVLSDSRGR